MAAVQGKEGWLPATYAVVQPSELVKQQEADAAAAMAGYRPIGDDSDRFTMMDELMDTQCFERLPPTANAVAAARHDCVVAVRKPRKLDPAKVAADCVSRLVAQLEQRAAAEAKAEAKARTKVAAKAAKAHDTLVRKAAKKVAAAAIAAVKARAKARAKRFGVAVRAAAKKVAFAAIAAVKARYAPRPVRVSQRARAKAQAKDYAEPEAAEVEAAETHGAPVCASSRPPPARLSRPPPEDIEIQRAIKSTLEFQTRLPEERLRLALTAEEVQERAAAEGLPLIRLPGTRTGFKGVYVENGHGPLPYVTRLCRAGGGKLTLGTYVTAEEAALHYARCVGKAAALSFNDAVHSVGLSGAATDCQQAVTKSDVLLQAAEEGLELLKSTRCVTGYKGVVTQRNGWYGAQDYDAQSRTTVWLGNFRLVEEAALAFARYKAGTLEPATGATMSASPASNMRRSMAAVHGNCMRSGVQAPFLSTGERTHRPRQSGELVEAVEVGSDDACEDDDEEEVVEAVMHVDVERVRLV